MTNAPIRVAGEAMPGAQIIDFRLYREAASAQRRLHDFLAAFECGGDQLLTLVSAYRVERARFNASSSETDEEFERDAEMLHLLFHALACETPPCSTAEGAVEALRLIAEDMAGSIGGFHAPVLRAVADYAGRFDHPAV